MKTIPRPENYKHTKAETGTAKRFMGAGLRASWPALCMVVALVSCGGEKGTPAPVETDSIMAPPSVMPDTFREPEPEPEPIPEKKLGPVHSADEVLAFMNASPDSALYAEGVIGLIA